MDRNAQPQTLARRGIPPVRRFRLRVQVLRGHAERFVWPFHFVRANVGEEQR